jgi:site-specific recombinase XerD
VTLLQAISDNSAITLSENARKYLLNSRSPQTRRAYQSDFLHFSAFCRSQNVTALPALPVTVAAYLVMLAESGIKPATIARRPSAISKAHSLARLDSPSVYRRLY